MGELAVILIVVGLAWWFYMMTFRTDEYLKLLKADEERKAKRNERAVNAAKHLAGWWLKK